MPSCKVTNHTGQSLNICLKQVTALHFENGVKPGQTIKFKPGRVWFTLEAVLDDKTKKSRYSILKSAATIAVLSLAVGAVAATAGAALLPEAAALEAVAAASVAGTYLAKGVTVTKAALISNSGTIAKLSSVALPKAIDRFSAEIGGLSALQREVLSIIASPTLSTDVRHRATNLLKQLHTAYKTDKTKTQSTQSTQPTQSQNPSTASITPLSTDEARELEAELQAGKLDDRVEEMPVRTGEVLRVHGIYMDRAREFEVRRGEGGRLELWDAHEGRIWVRGKEKGKGKGKEELGNEKGSNEEVGGIEMGSIGKSGEIGREPVQVDIKGDHAETHDEKSTSGTTDSKIGRWGSWGRKTKQ